MTGKAASRARLPVLLAVSVCLLISLHPQGRDTGAFLLGSERVLVGTVTAQSTSVEPRTGRIVTESRVRVERVCRGRTTEELILVEFGGRIGDRIVVASHSPSYAIGGRYLIFADDRPDGASRTRGGWLGRLPVTTDNEGREWILLGGQHPLVTSSTMLRPGLEALDEVLSRLARPGGLR